MEDRKKFDLETKKACILKERARALAEQSKFYEATSILEDIEEEIFELGIKLLMAECYLQLGRENKANRAIKYVEKALTSPPVQDPDEIISLADDLIANSSFTRAVLLLQIAGRIIQSSAHAADDVVRGIFRCFSKVDDAVTPMIKAANNSRVTVVDFAMESMAQMLENIRSVQNCNLDEKTLKEAWCAKYLDFNHSLLGETRKCVAVASQAVERLEKHFGKNVAQHRVYGVILHNLGVTLFNNHRLQESEIVHIKAIEAKENALDYEDEETRVKDIEASKRGLRLVRGAMG